MDALAELNKRLRLIAGLLDGAASLIRDAPLPSTNAHIRRIGEALASVYEIQGALYKLRPELEVPYEDAPEEVRAANKRLGDAMIAAYDLADTAMVAEAIALLADFAKNEPSEYHRSIANGEVERLKANYET
ncbi:hypothetical protein ACFPOE_13570 [Caenimonas terrae]|uniref:Uncharacterized protein n=1 Tax=Caenimonas terrae TaxID=696074 RepID=A0ABW0NDG3_9BURK